MLINDIEYDIKPGADLRDADLRDADLRDADLRDADLRDADLRGANIKNVRWPAPSVVLLAWWGVVSDWLTLMLMRYDCANLENGKHLFDEWKTFGFCPYRDANIERSAHFYESRALWSYGPSKSALKLMQMLLKEKCK